MANKKSENLKIAMSLIDTDKKIIVPEYEEGREISPNQYVRFGDRNLYPNQLHDMVRNSVTMQAVLNGTVNFIKGQDAKLNDDIRLAYYPFMNKNRETEQDLIEQMGRDIFIYGGCYLHIIKNRLGDIAELYVIPFDYMRTNYQCDKFWYSRYWGKYGGKVIIYPIYDKTSDATSMIYYYNSTRNRSTYPESPVTSSFEDMIIENISQKYSTISLDNGLSAKHIINLPDSANLTDEEKSKIEKGIKDKFTGVANAGSFMIYYAPTTDPLGITKLDMDNTNDIFTTLRNSAQDNIFISCNAIPELFGVKKSGTGFNAVEYNTAYQIYNNIKVIPIQNKIKEIFEVIFGQNAITITPYKTNLE